MQREVAAQDLPDLVLAPLNSNAGFVSPDLNPANSPGVNAATDVNKSGYNVTVAPGATVLPATAVANLCTELASMYFRYKRYDRMEPVLLEAIRIREK